MILQSFGVTKIKRAIILLVALAAILQFAACFDDHHSPTSPEHERYIGNRNTRHLHRPTCSYLPHQENQVYFDMCVEAINAGYHNCKHCEPC